MMDFIMAPLIVGICVLGIYKLFELFARRRERLAIIEKLNEGISVDHLSLSLPNYSQARLSYGALKTGCLLIGVGVGLLVGFFISMVSIPDFISNFRNWDYREIFSLIYGSCVLLFGGVGLIAAFIIEMKMEKKKN
ncbi:hypothetical protein LJC72_00320 [Bacteroides sp. OttesenSCG-928-D19]|nr:hypothetical protein [Bacteroides sp. OttesenSCG-928-D19]